MALPYLIDGEELNPQPRSHEWDDREILGHDGEGFPIYAKYSAVTLRVRLNLRENHWRGYVDYEDGRTLHTITLPARDTVDDFTQYVNVVVDSVTHGAVEKTSGMANVEMRVIRIEE